MEKNNTLPSRRDLRPKLVLGVDGIGVIKTIRRKVFRPVHIDSLIKIKRSVRTQAFAKPRIGQFWIRQRFRLPVFASLVLISFSFATGAFLTWSANETSADKQRAALVGPNKTPLELPVVAGTSSLGPIAKVPNEILFNLTLDQLEIYLQEALKTPELKEAELLAERKAKLKVYLEEKKSPFTEIINTLAELKHWKMVLAISNSESTLGKRCYNNNCSGIGVEPGHPYWRNYESKAEWAKDLDRLIEKRYKNYTLEKMNGVYNQPGSKNWLLASKQILEELQERGIE